MTERRMDESEDGDDAPIAFARPYLGVAAETNVAKVVRSGWIVGGSRLAEFERRFAALCGARHAVGVSSWTTGAFLVLHAWGIGPGDEVIVPSLTFIATVNVIRHVGATPVFAEIDARTFNIDPADVLRKIGPARASSCRSIRSDCLATSTRSARWPAVSGSRCSMTQPAPLRAGNRGRPVGSLADVTVFSLHARKIVTTGEGGMIVTDDDAFAERLRRLRHQGMSLQTMPATRCGLPCSRATRRSATIAA